MRSVTPAPSLPQPTVSKQFVHVPFSCWAVLFGLGKRVWVGWGANWWGQSLLFIKPRAVKQSMPLWLLILPIVLLGGQMLGAACYYRYVQGGPEKNFIGSWLDLVFILCLFSIHFDCILLLFNVSEANNDIVAILLCTCTVKQFSHFRIFLAHIYYRQLQREDMTWHDLCNVITTLFMTAVNA